jgi:putative heme-binding domain-containing protein
MLPMLERRLAQGKLADKERSLVVDILVNSEDKAAAPILLGALAREASSDVRDKILAGLKANIAGKWGFLTENPDLGRAISKLLEDPKTQIAGLGLVETANKEDFQAKVLSLAADNKQPEEVRLAALHALGTFHTQEAGQGVQGIFQKENVPAVRLAALKALGRQGMPKAQDVLRAILQNREIALEERQAAAAGMAGTYGGAEWLLKAYQSKGLGDDLSDDVARLLRNSPYKEVKKLAATVLPAPPKLDPKKLPSIQALLARKGSAQRGQLVMEKTLKNDAACLKCHTINKVGGAVGPELSVIGSKASRENLLESILYPSRAIADQYIQWVVETKGGQVINAIVIEETPDYLLLRDVNAKDYKVARKDLEAKTKSPKSIMPDNLLLFLSEEELVDVVEYLYSLKSPPLAPTSWRREEKPTSVAF